MARRSLKLDEYPEQFRRLVEKASGEEEYFLEISPHTARISIKATLARFLKAIRGEVDRWEREERKTWTKELPWFVKLGDYAARTTVGETEKGIRLFPRGRGKVALLLEQALDKAGVEKGEGTREEQTRDTLMKGLGKLQHLIERED